MRRATRSSSTCTDAIIDALRLSDEQWYALLDSLDRTAAENPVNASARRHERVSYRNVIQLVVVLKYADGRHQRFRVRTRNLSVSGLAFLHGNYVHQGTGVEVILPNHARGYVRHHAVVRRCQHLTQTIHEVGVEFESPLDNIDDYLLATPDAD